MGFTLSQIRLLARAADARMRQDTVRLALATRAAVNADGAEFSRYVDEMTRQDL